MSLGLEPGDFVLLQARCTPEHSIADMGVVHARGTPVSLYNTLAPEQIDYVVFYDKPLLKFDRLLETFATWQPPTGRFEPPPGV